jgi:hypothetical protein
MKKLISAVTSLCMAASMVCTVVPATVGAADASKGLSIKTYDIQNPSADSAKSEITIAKADIPAGGYKIPSAVYYSEATVNSTGSMLASITTDSKDIQFKMYDPALDAYTSEKKAYKLGDVEFETNKYISFAGYAKSKRDGYKAGGAYQMACESSQTAAKTDNYFIGCSWMNDGRDYAWAGEKSDSYPFYVFDTIIPQDIKAGTYKVMFCDYNTDATGKNDNPCPMVESQGTRYTKKEGNLKLSELTIKVTDGPTDETTTTTKAPDKTTTTTTKAPDKETTTTTKPPVSDADVSFSFVEYESQKNTITAKPGQKIDVDVNITAGNKPVSALDVQFKANGLKITSIGEGTEAFDGKTVNSNLSELRANYATLKGDTPMVPVDGKTAFMLTIKVPSNAKNGTYTLGFDSQCKIFKDNTSFNYTTAFTPLKVTVGDVVTTTTTQKPDDKTTTTTTVSTTKAPDDKTTTTTTTTKTPDDVKTIKVTMWGDANVDGKVNVADVVAIRNMAADMDKFLADAEFKFDKAQGRVNADVVDPQDITGAACDPAKVKITGTDADLIINYIISNGYDMAKAVTPKKS